MEEFIKDILPKLKAAMNDMADPRQQKYAPSLLLCNPAGVFLAHLLHLVQWDQWPLRDCDAALLEKVLEVEALQVGQPACDIQE
jgi:hypothetical protein